MEVVLPPLVAPAYFPKDGEVVGLFAWVLVVYREVVGALELVLARRPAVWRERFYARERDRLPIDDSIHPRDLWGGRRRGRELGNAMAYAVRVRMKRGPTSLNHWSNVVQLGMKRETPGMQTGLGSEVARSQQAAVHGARHDAGTYHDTIYAHGCYALCHVYMYMHGAPCTTPAVRAECRLDQPCLPKAGVEAVRAGFTVALEVGVRHRVVVAVLVHPEVVVGHVEREHRWC